MKVVNHNIIQDDNGNVLFINKSILLDSSDKMRYRNLYKAIQRLKYHRYIIRVYHFYKYISSHNTYATHINVFIDAPYLHGYLPERIWYDVWDRYLEKMKSNE